MPGRAGWSTRSRNASKRRNLECYLAQSTLCFRNTLSAIQRCTNQQCFAGRRVGLKNAKTGSGEQKQKACCALLGLPLNQRRLRKHRLPLAPRCDVRPNFWLEKTPSTTSTVLPTPSSLGVFLLSRLSWNTLRILPILVSLSPLRPYLLTVRKPPSQGGNRGSIPRRVTEM